MELINRGVVVIKPKEPFLEWVNREVDLSSPVTMKDLQKDCTVMLVPDLYSLEDMLDYLSPLRPLLFEGELESWSRDPATWPGDRTAEAFEAWFELEAHSGVWDAVDGPVVKGEDDMPLDLSGTWHVAASPDFDDDYLDMEAPSHVTLCQSDGGGVRGEFQIGLIQGFLDGHPGPGGYGVLFSFEGADEMDPVNGAGTITFWGGRLIFRLLFHLGDEYTFECELAEDQDL